MPKCPLVTHRRVRRKQVAMLVPSRRASLYSSRQPRIAVRAHFFAWAQHIRCDLPGFQPPPPCFVQSAHVRPMRGQSREAPHLRGEAGRLYPGLPPPWSAGWWLGLSTHPPRRVAFRPATQRSSIPPAASSSSSSRRHRCRGCVPTVMFVLALCCPRASKAAPRARSERVFCSRVPRVRRRSLRHALHSVLSRCHASF